ncbi:hypothetical protein KFL_001340310 [Klebsormidium nitens]|uniref:Uncharacterized protein n=1 Tax=Klebsormidium nitens TaxID=105231 RepID=A0A1Y1I2V9_KLENI|nr:hypothetical protein KFL_001340310 [Klebsormidium nitens]|eukprot:GAQ83076.1 hypothetical protein KFL_001340310 [Klebsormidium nitens]
MKSYEECCEECQEQNPFFKLGGGVVGRFAYTRQTPFIQPFETIESPWADFIKSDSLETNIKKLYKLAQKYGKDTTEEKKAVEERPEEKEETPVKANAGDTISITLPENSIVNLDAFTLYGDLATGAEQIWMENLHNMGLSADMVGAMDGSLDSITKFKGSGFFHYFKFNVDNDEGSSRLSSGLDTRGSASTITWQTTGTGSGYLPTVFVECTALMEPIEEVAEAVEETVEAPAAPALGANGKPKKPCSPEKLKQMALMREKAALKKQAMKELTEKEKALKQKTFEERVKKVQALEKTFKPEPEPKAPEPEPQEESEAEVEVVKVKKAKKPVKKVKKVIYESDSDSSASSESDDDHYQRKQKRRFIKTVKKEVAKEVAKLTAARPTQRDMMHVAARDEINSKVSKAMRDLAIKSVFPE